MADPVTELNGSSTGMDVAVKEVYELSIRALAQRYVGNPKAYEGTVQNLLEESKNPAVLQKTFDVAVAEIEKQNKDDARRALPRL